MKIEVDEEMARELVRYVEDVRNHFGLTKESAFVKTADAIRAQLPPEYKVGDVVVSPKGDIFVRHECDAEYPWLDVLEAINICDAEARDGKLIGNLCDATPETLMVFLPRDYVDLCTNSAVSKTLQQACEKTLDTINRQ